MGKTSSSRVGETFGPYELESLLGKGGMGDVYRAHDTVRDRVVALKLLPSHLAEDPVFKERFRRECQTLARLDEPHVIPIHDFGEIDGQLFLDMRLVKGRDLRVIMRERGALEPTAAVSLIEQVAAALDAAHAAGMVHRDVKPENILVTNADFAYLADFGIAHAETDSHLTHTGTAIGSVAYMAPEQFDDESVTPAVDTYALTVTLFELLTGQKPYPGESVSAITKSVLFDEIPVASQINPAITPAMDAVLARGLNKKPEDRCPSPLELAHTARAALSVEHRPTTDDADTNLLADPGTEPTVVGIPAAATVVGTTAAPPTSWPYTVIDLTPVDTGTESSPPEPPSRPTPVVKPTPVITPTPMIKPTAVAETAGGYGQPSGYPPQPYPPVYPQQQARRGPTSPILIGAVSVFVTALLGISAWLVVDKVGSSNSKETPAAANTSVVPSGGMTTYTTTATPAWTTTYTATATPTWTPGSPPSDNQTCPGFSGVGTGYPQWTGCEFAANVRDAYVQSGPMGGSRTVNGWAPQQQKNYVMTCGPYLGVIACRGGNQAVVYIY